MSTYDARLTYLQQRQGLLRHALRSIRLRAADMLMAHRTRALLSEMDGHLLKDIGLTRGEAIAEATRPMWDLR